ncbi:MAG: glycosyltransferase family 2 protein [Bdellovibrionales bacterium]
MPEYNSVPTVSVLLPVFNGGKLLLRAVRSILSQSMPDFELIIINDGSTDQALHDIRAMKESRVRIIGSNTRLGLVERLNEGIDAAQGRLIARMDADDIAFPRRLEMQRQFLDEHADIDLVGCRAIVFRDLPDNARKIIGLLPFVAPHEEICAHPWRGFSLPHPTWMGRASWFRRFRYATPEVKGAEDQELLLRSYAESRFACLEDVLLGYRQGDFSLLKTLRTRGYWLVAQERHFMAHKGFISAVLALSLTLAKIGIDLLAALPGCSRLFFARMGGKPSESDIESLDCARVQA